MVPCKFFAQGRCTYGASCRNSHEPALDAVASTSKLGPRKQPTFLENRKSSSPNTSTAKSPCWFFSQGTCTYGASCRMSHDLPFTTPIVNAAQDLTNSSLLRETLLSSSSAPVPVAAQRHSGGSAATPLKLKAEAHAFVPSAATEAQHLLVGGHFQVPLCRYFAKGFCRNGETCHFRHESNTAVWRGTGGIDEEQNISTLVNAAAQLSITTSLSQDFNGATVTFQAGAEVADVKLSSDFSTIQILGLSPDARPGFVSGLLAGFGYHVVESSVVVKSLGDAGSVAEVKIENPKFAKDVTRKFDTQKEKGAKTKLSIKPMLGNAAMGALANRLQLSTVTCTWYKPSRPAWLAFQNHSDAIQAKQIFETCKILQRSPTCTFQANGRQILSRTLQVGNLDVRTRKKDLHKVLQGSQNPESITLGDPSYSHSDVQAANIIESILRTKGALESFQWLALPGSTKLKAIATFGDRDEAAEAVRSLNGTSHREVGNSKLFLGHVISVKYNVPNAVMAALQGGIDRLREEIWQNGHVHLKTYPQTEQTKPVTSVRVFGETLKYVAEAKGRMERLLTGVVVMDGDVALWDPHFLGTTSLAYLNEISKTHKLYIHRDARKSHLIMYGGSDISRSEVGRILLAKVLTLRRLTHAIILTPALLAKATQGGMRRLKARFGSAVTLNVLANPKTISIAGCSSDFQEAQALLVDGTNYEVNIDSKSGTGDCEVCWSEATEPLSTHCGHIYCKDCFANQASSGNLPMRCYGAGGKCLQVFPLNELKTLLSLTVFRELLQDSFDAYIRQHPKDFQHCPTADCPQVYRITTTGETFLCSTCLTPVCTTCNVIVHDGMTCEEYKDLSSEGTKAFQKWKKENDARDCPNCMATIQKIEGCNHMACKQCSTHICWFCMKNFATSGECYGHMQKSHGNFYGP